MIASVKLPPELKNVALSAKQRKHPHFLLGKYGEQLAQEFLVAHKYRIVGQNIRWKQYEADIIAYDTQTQQVVIVEVKTRKSALVAPHLAISYKKLKSLQVFAKHFVRLHYQHFQTSFSYRIDAICVVQDQVTHFENVSWWR